MSSQMPGTVLLSPFQTLPVELITEIISHVLANGMKKRVIASVCKACKLVILGTPRFWRQFSISQWAVTISSPKHFRRVLELSCSITLDVSLQWDPIDEDMQGQFVERIKALVDAGIHRWRSLSLVESRATHARANPLHGVFKGKLSSLRSLSINQGRQRPGQRNIFDPLYILIAETNPCLHDFTCLIGEPPELLARLPIYSNLRSIRGNPAAVARLRPKFDVPELHVNSEYAPNTFKAFQLPHTTSFNSIKLSQLSACDLNNVQVLKVNIGCVIGDNNVMGDPVILKFPRLHTLEVYIYPHDSIPWLLDTEAPRLCSLTIVNSVIGDIQPGKYLNDIFKNEKKSYQDITHAG